MRRKVVGLKVTPFNLPDARVRGYYLEMNGGCAAVAS